MNEKLSSPIAINKRAKACPHTVKAEASTRTLDYTIQSCIHISIYIHKEKHCLQQL